MDPIAPPPFSLQETFLIYRIDSIPILLLNKTVLTACRTRLKEIWTEVRTRIWIKIKTKLNLTSLYISRYETRRRYSRPGVWNDTNKIAKRKIQDIFLNYIHKNGKTIHYLLYNSEYILHCQWNNSRWLLLPLKVQISIYKLRLNQTAPSVKNRKLRGVRGS